VSEEVEGAGIPTVALSMEDGMSAPRVARVPFPYNFPMGAAGGFETRRGVAIAALSLLGELEEPGEENLPFEWNG
jgi:D-proline reductase (dithiol) PrdB